MGHGQENRNGFIIAGRQFSCREELEEYCFCDPQFEDEVSEQEYWACLEDEIDTYYFWVEFEYGDGRGYRYDM